MNAQMVELDLTPEFRTYREAARLMWNVFLKNTSDQEDAFLEIDGPLFHAIMESRLDMSLEQLQVNRVNMFSDLEVQSLHENALWLRRTPTTNVWDKRLLPPLAKLRFIRLFDFDAFGGSERDFEYIRCLRVDEPPSEGTAAEVLVLARDARVVYLGRGKASSA